jgi:hypothetical protein
VAERSEAGWGIAQRLVDHDQNALQVSINFVVPEAQSPEPLAGKVPIALRVAPRMGIEVMLTAVNLDNQTLLETDKIDDVASARRLTAKMESAFFP